MSLVYHMTKMKLLFVNVIFDNQRKEFSRAITNSFLQSLGKASPLILQQQHPLLSSPSFIPFCFPPLLFPLAPFPSLPLYCPSLPLLLSSSLLPSPSPLLLLSHTHLHHIRTTLFMYLMSDVSSRITAGEGGLLFVSVSALYSFCYILLCCQSIGARGCTGLCQRNSLSILAKFCSQNER